MSRLSAIYSILSGTSNITNLTSTRIYPVFPPQGSAFPLIVFTLGNNDPTDQKDGSSPIDTDRLQIDIYSRTALEAETLDGYVRAALDSYSGTAATVVIREIYYTGSTAPEYDQDINVYWFSSDYIMKVQR